MMETLLFSDLFSQIFGIYGFLLTWSPFWAPPILLFMFYAVWIQYVRANFISSQETVLLEVRLPQEVRKSPVAMQAVFDGLAIASGESTFIDRIWLGKVRTWYSFEMASFEGRVHFFIWTRVGFRRTIERIFYAQYPDCEIVEAHEYACRYPFSLETHDVHGADFALGGAIGIPIKTYTDFKLDQTNTKEEEKTDPLSTVLELLGSMGKGEQLWVQIICRANKKEDYTFGFVHNEKSYKDLANGALSAIRSKPEQAVVLADGNEVKTLSDEQIKQTQAINRVMLNSSHWDVGIRTVYIAEKEYFDPANISAVMSMWNIYGSPGFNKLVPDGSRWLPMFDYPWQDFRNIRHNEKKVKFIDAYRRRSWFHPPYRFKPLMMTAEELASIFHLPGSVTKTPTLERIQSTRAQAPPNLPQ